MIQEISKYIMRFFGINDEAEEIVFVSDEEKAAKMLGCVKELFAGNGADVMKEQLLDYSRFLKELNAAYGDLFNEPCFPSVFSYLKDIKQWSIAPVGYRDLFEKQQKKIKLVNGILEIFNGDMSDKALYFVFGENYILIRSSYDADFCICLPASEKNDTELVRIVGTEDLVTLIHALKMARESCAEYYAKSPDSISFKIWGEKFGELEERMVRS